MKLKTRTEYAYWALVELAENRSSNRPVTIPEIAGHRKIPERFLLQVMGALKRAGLVESVRGKAGGYLLSKEPEEITFYEIYAAMENSKEQLPCNQMVGTCQNTTTNCSLARVWTQANKNLHQQLEGITLARMIEEDREKQTLTYHI